MKKITFLFVALVCAIGLSAAEIVKLDGLYYQLGTTTASLVQDQSSDKSVYKEYTSVTIPASVTYNAYTYPVTSLGTSAFEGCSNLQSVVLPASITLIGTDAFYGCVKLGSVNLEEGLTTINQRAFQNCNLSSVTIPSTVTSIGNAAFKNCPLTTVVWKPVECSIGTNDLAPFYSTSSEITSFTFGDQVKTIPAYLCKNMTKLEAVVIPASVNSLGTYAFANCSSLKSINLPVTQKTLPVSFFEGCISLEKIVLPATLTTISQDAFYGCTSLKDVNIDEGLVTIGNRAFYNCKLTSVTIPSTVTSIGTAAFKACPLTSVVWKPAECSIATDDSAPFYSTSSQITSFTFGAEVKVIPAYLCKNMSQLESVEIPASVTSIEQSAFMYCTKIKSFTFPAGIKTVATSVLEGCTGLETVIIPEFVTTINQDAFYNCSALKAIYNYALTPQTITERTVTNVNKNTCMLYVPIDFIDLYQAKAVWCDFKNIIGVATGLHFDELTTSISYLENSGDLLYMEPLTLQVPLAPKIDGFTFVQWQVQMGDLKEGIVLKAVYKANEPTDAPQVIVETNNMSHKLVREGNVYILQNDRLYDMSGKRVN